MPKVSGIQAASTQGRTQRAHAASTRPSMRAAIAKAKTIDLYLPDHRGTGRSARLACPTAETASSPGGTQISDGELPGCVESMKSTWGDKLASFNITNAARDVGEFIRAQRETARMSVRRLEAEILRDSLLAVSGKLNPEVGGAPVPVMFNEEGQVVIGIDTTDTAGRPSGKIVPLNGAEFRRSIYVQARRSRQLEMFATMVDRAVGNTLEGIGQPGQRRQHVVGVAAVAHLARAPQRALGLAPRLAGDADGGAGGFGHGAAAPVGWWGTDAHYAQPPRRQRAAFRNRLCPSRGAAWRSTLAPDPHDHHEKTQRHHPA